MAEQFVGLDMLVTLTTPPDAQLQGKVYSVVAGKSLTLRDVYCPGNGRTITEITIQASDISDLSEAPRPIAQPVVQPVVQPIVQPVVQPVAQPVVQPIVQPQPAFPIPSAAQGQPTSRPASKTFNDPAIVSVGRPGSGISPMASVPPSRNVSTGPQIPSLSLPSQQASRKSSVREPLDVRDQLADRKVTPAAILVDPMQSLDIEDEQEKAQESDKENAIENELNEAAEEQDSDAEGLVKERNRKRRGRGTRARKTKAADATDGDDNYLVPVSMMKNPKKGWRQTPLLEPTQSFQPFTVLKKKAKAGKGYDNGWATEEATDVQDMGDFDFQASLSKFDKRTVFEGIKANDMMADEDRLVGVNRVPKPGTMGGRNLLPSENVLEMEPSWNSEAGDSGEEVAVSQRGSASGRTSHRGESRLRMSAKKESSIHSQPRQSPRSKSQAQDVTSAPSAQAKSSFYLVPADRRVEVASPLQMLNLENVSSGELGLTEDMMTENAARGIAEVALSALNPGGRRLTQGNAIKLPNVVIYAGNNKSGTRAIAAGRHLRNHGASVVVCVLGLEKEPELLEGVRRQLKVFRSFGGDVFTKEELKDHIRSLDVLDLIIDGLLGLSMSYEELRTEDQAAAFELIQMANRVPEAVLSVDVPTGLEATTGKPMTLFWQEVWIQPSLVVSMGVPKTGLLEAMRTGTGTEAGKMMGRGRPWQLFVADIGIGKNAWKKSGMRARRGVEFEGSWMLGMRFQKGTD